MSAFEKALVGHRACFDRLTTLGPTVVGAASAVSKAMSSGRKLMLCGNGGSAADSQHLAAELTGRLYSDRRPLAALALSTDTSALTCISNDYAFDQVFSRQIEALGVEGDCLIAISTSGKSSNVIEAAKLARSKGITVIGLLGRDGGTLKSLCDLAIVVPETDTARIQEAHIFIGHVICSEVERLLGLSSTP